MYRGNTITVKPVVFILAQRVKKPNRPEANQLAIYKSGRGFELGITVSKSSQAVWGVIKPGASGLQFQLSNRSVTLPPFEKNEQKEQNK